MLTENARRTIATAVVIALLLGIVAAILVMISPKKPENSSIAANKSEIPATRPATREVVRGGLSKMAQKLAEELTLPPGATREVLQTIPATSYDAKDGGQDNTGHIGYWDPLTWVRYNKVDFGKGISSVSAMVSCGAQFPGRILYFHLDSRDGPVFGEIAIPTTNGFETISAPAKEVDGVHDVFITCTDGGFNLQSIKFTRPQKATDLISATSYAASSGIQEPRPGIVGHTDEGDWVKYEQIDFGAGVSSLAVDLAMGPRDARLNFHLDTSDGPLIAELIPMPTGDWNTYAIQETPVKNAAGVHDLYIIFHGAAKGLPDIRTIQFKSDTK